MRVKLIYKDGGFGMHWAVFSWRSGFVDCVDLVARGLVYEGDVLVRHEFVYGGVVSSWEGECV